MNCVDPPDSDVFYAAGHIPEIALVNSERAFFSPETGLDSDAYWFNGNIEVVHAKGPERGNV